MSRVVLLDPGGRPETVAQTLAGHPELTVEQAQELPGGEDVTAILVPPEIFVGRPELQRLPNLKVVATTSTGFDHLDLEAIAAHQAWATHCPGYCSQEVAEHAIALAVGLLRGVVELDRGARQGIWDESPAAPRRIAGATLGVIGLGRIGSEVAWRGRGLGMHVLGSDPMLSQHPDAELVDLDQLLQRSAVITLHAMLTPQTRAMIGARELALMAPGSYLVNCSRAALVDHEALGRALVSGHLGGAALDVLPIEPPARDEPAFGWPRTVINPHSSWYSPESATAPYRMAAEAVVAVLEGREPAGLLARPALTAPGPAAHADPSASPPDRLSPAS
jgi:D-3-phosphoglycerate dehydrogenase / 2-oxoglutarate reductase